MDIPSFSVRVLVNGNRTKEYNHEGKTFIEAKKGSEYEIDIRNHSAVNVLAIPSVDGICTISGEKATDNSPGFIMKPFSNLLVKGYTYNNEEVGAFKFSDKGKGYASEKGSSQNVGVIGVKFIGESPQYASLKNNPYRNVSTYPYIGTPINPVWELNGTNPITGTDNLVWNNTSFSCGGFVDAKLSYLSDNVSMPFSEAPDFTVETTWGSKKIQKTKEKDFYRGNEVGLIEIFYSDRDSLLKSGVITPQSDSVNFPQSFSSYASPPKNWP